MAPACLAGAMMKRRGFWIAALSCCLPFCLRAEVVTDGSVGLSQSLDGPVFHIGAALGQQAGQNLFHSFSQFNLSQEESAVFTGPAEINHVISRVTGGSPSYIDGSLSSEIAGADFYFLNPAGLLFGPDARLDIPGSVYLSTASQLRMGDGTLFDTNPSLESVLSSAAPESFGFLGAKTDIEVNGSRLQVPTGGALSLSSGGLQVRGGVLSALDGRVSIDTQGGDFNLSHSGSIEAGGGQVMIRSGNFYMENTQVTARPDSENTAETSEGIQIVVADSIQLDSGKISTDREVKLSANHISLNNGSTLFGDGGITVNADSVSLNKSQFSASLNSTQAQTQNHDISIQTGKLTLQDRALISVFSSSAGDAGNIEVQAGTVSLDGESALLALANIAQGGNITLDISQRLVVVDESLISATARGDKFDDNGGNVVVRNPRFTILSKADIKANANHGHGGNIHLGGDYLLSDNSTLDASSKLGVDGQVVLDAPMVDLSPALLAQTPAYLDTPGLTQGCVERLGKQTSELRVSRYGILPLSPWGKREIWPLPEFAIDDPAATAYRNGDYRQAANLWQVDVLPHGSIQWIDAKLGLVAAYRHLGMAGEAVALAQTLWDSTKSLPSRRIRAGQMLGTLLQLLHRHEKSETVLARSLELARQFDDRELVSSVLNQQAGFLSAQDKLSLYQNAYTQAPKHSIPAFKILLNALLEAAGNMSSDRRSREFIRDNLSVALSIAERLPVSYETTLDLLALAELQDKLPVKAGQPHILKQIRQIAGHLHNPRLLSWAYGKLGGYDNTHELEYTRQALFFAQQAHAPELLYLWSAQLADILSQKGENTGAAKAYRQAVATLRPIRAFLIADLGWDNVEETLRINQIYRRAIDFSLRQAKSLTAGEQARALQDILAIVEQYKQFELENYFRDECLTLLRQTPLADNTLPSRTAVLYPLLFDTRIDLVLRIGKNIRVYISKVGVRQLENTVKRWEDKDNALKLYKWLIEPIAAELESGRVENLVIVPDSSLYTMPFSALYDGREYLVQKPYALTMSPALSLTTVTFPEYPVRQALLAGISQPFSDPLRTRRELENSAAILDGYTSLFILDQALTKQALAGALEKNYYPLVHLATHAHFDDDIDQSFVQLNDERLGFSELEKLLRPFANYPLELLVLSACETAKGKDNRAALGLAGMAVKTGARSVLGSLWKVDDAAAAELTPAFYAQWLRTGSEARALQKAQQALLAEHGYQNPTDWAAFILIGNLNASQSAGAFW